MGHSERSWRAGPGDSIEPMSPAEHHGTVAGVAADSDDATILRRFGFELDPVIEAYKRDVDRTLLRQNLRRSPEERCHNFVAAVALAEEMRRAGAARRGH